MRNILGFIAIFGLAALAYSEYKKSKKTITNKLTVKVGA